MDNSDHDKRMLTFPLGRELKFKYKDGRHDCTISVVTDNPGKLAANNTHFIIVQEGQFSIIDTKTNHIYSLKNSQYACLYGEIHLAGKGQALVISIENYCGITQTGGPIEEHGRLRYIDGCTSSIIVSPPVRGEPCLNLLCLPKQTKQTMHVHPSLRVGLILSGNGKCDTNQGMLNFEHGTGFLLPPDTAHSFQSQDQDMRIVIFHPDSDSGPTHTDHTMLNRTFVNGKSAQQLSDIHTTETV